MNEHDWFDSLHPVKKVLFTLFVVLLPFIGSIDNISF